jgi:hypothetical protein
MATYSMLAESAISSSSEEAVKVSADESEVGRRAESTVWDR